MKKILRPFMRKIKQLFLSPSAKRHGLVGTPELWKMKRDFQINFLKSIGLLPTHYLCDIGCGTLRGGIPLIDYLEKGHYCGIEFRDSVLEEGRKELREKNLDNKEPVLLVSKDLSALGLNSKFDFMWAFSVMIHLTDEIAEKCFAMVSKHLKPDGVYYANVNIGERAEGNWEGFPVVWRSLEFYQNLAAKYALKVEDIGDLRSFGHVTGVGSQDDQRMLRISALR
jgi:SAM-dependent methyltransferase